MRLGHLCRAGGSAKMKVASHKKHHLMVQTNRLDTTSDGRQVLQQKNIYTAFGGLAPTECPLNTAFA